MLKLSVHVNTGRLVKWRGSVESLSNFKQGADDVQLRFIQDNPTLGSSNQYIPAVLTGIAGPVMGLFTDVSFAEGFDEGDALGLTLQDAFTLNTDDANDPYYAGVFNTLTSQVASLGTLKTKACYLAIGLVKTADGSISSYIGHGGSTNATLEAALSGGFSAMLPVSVIPTRRRIQLPVYWLSEDGLREYVTAENLAQDGLVMTRYP